MRRRFLILVDNAHVRSAERLLRALHPELPSQKNIELRWKSPTEGGSMRRAFVPNVEEAAERAVSLGSTCDVYAGVATRGGEDGTKAGVCRVSALWADLVHDQATFSVTARCS